MKIWFLMFFCLYLTQEVASSKFIKIAVTAILNLSPSVVKCLTGRTIETILHEQFIIPILVTLHFNGNGGIDNLSTSEKRN